ncbi:endonuclease/exonuclease/phosphatase family protein [Hymenobacter sp. BT683]|uniref:Endonuclease/exonuclease/phosphatase family protein n=1 Tax=Hymenobacter jeongseonensis TaxID=2791027 RepID=A0ABS0IHK3_9BACT|nr:endonuclease/exonuclease/phosphatase family protein [Hymenobacter jeongseonensis]MBF9237834.1 endonuclease/exonuclease/phosphatase family protein [Hymenobacter jeongseonensis]
MALLLTIGHWVVWVVGGVALVATLLPILRQTAWWIRAFDFPRLQIVAGLALSLIAELALPGTSGLAHILFSASLGLGIVYQASRIWPYTPLHSQQVARATRPDDDNDNHISLMVANVLMYNRDASRLLGHVNNLRPDILLALETDDWWLSQLERIEKDYPYTCHAPLPNTYGMLVFSRLPLREPQIRYILDNDIPSFHGCVVLPSGVAVNLHFLHPKPPAPQESKSSAPRDAELLVVGKVIHRQDARPTIVAGDLNDVAWSHTSELFRRISRLLDPRIGRGLLPTFHADHKLLRWPLDHVFHSAHFRLQRLERLTHIGSDHFPIYIRLSYEPNGWHEQEKELEQADAGDHQEAEEKIEEGVAEANDPNAN